MKKMSNEVKSIKISGQGCLDDCARRICSVVDTVLTREYDPMGSTLWCVEERTVGQTFHDAKWSVNL